MTQGLTCAGLAIALSMAGGCARPRVVTTFSDLETRLRPGTSVHVTNTAGDEIKGEVTAVSGPSLRIKLRDAAERDFAESAVARITVKDPIWNGAVIGAAVGVVGGGISDEGCSSPSAAPDCKKVSRGAGIAIMTAMGAGFGAALDALFWRRVPVFRASKRAGSVRFLMPVVGPHRAGVFVSTGF